MFSPNVLYKHKANKSAAMMVRSGSHYGGKWYLFVTWWHVSSKQDPWSMDHLQNVEIPDEKAAEWEIFDHISGRVTDTNYNEPIFKIPGQKAVGGV